MPLPDMNIDIRKSNDADRAWVRALMEEMWGLPVVSISGAYDPSDLPGLVAEVDGSHLGLLTYRIGAGECEVVTLNSLQEGRGLARPFWRTHRGWLTRLVPAFG